MRPEADEARTEAPPECVDTGAASAPGPTPAGATESGKLWSMLAMVIASLALLAAIGTQWSQRQDVQPIAVIDIPALVASDPALGGDAGRAKIEAVIQGLVDAGYIVVDSDAVLGAPGNAYVTPSNQEGLDASRH